MYKFHFHSTDGEHKRNYDSLEVFEQEWTNGQPAPFESGTYTTMDGITLIYPDNDATLDALRQRYEAKQEMERNPILPMQAGIFEAIGVDRLALEALQKANDPQATVETQYGQARLVSDKQRLACREVLNAAIAAMTKQRAPASIHGVIVARDDLHGRTVVVDTLSETISLDELLTRPTVPSMTLDVHNESFEGFNDDGVYADTKIAGDVQVMRALTPQIMALEEISYKFDVVPYGFSNSSDHPMDAYQLKSLTESADEIKGVQLVIHKDTGAFRTAVHLSATTTKALGSLNAGLYIQSGDETVLAEHGKVLLLDKDSMTMSVHETSIMHQYREPQYDGIFFSDPSL